MSTKVGTKVKFGTPASTARFDYFIVIRLFTEDGNQLAEIISPTSEDSWLVAADSLTAYTESK